jgi:hypothetical protein
MRYATIVAIGLSLVLAAMASYERAVQDKQTKSRIDLLERQADQLKNIIYRCGAELCIDIDGNYDALIPMTTEEFEEFKKQIRDRKKMETQDTATPEDAKPCEKCGKPTWGDYPDICPDCESSDPRFVG